MTERAVDKGKMKKIFSPFCTKKEENGRPVNCNIRGITPFLLSCFLDMIFVTIKLSRKEVVINPRELALVYIMRTIRKFGLFSFALLLTTFIPCSII